MQKKSRSWFYNTKFANKIALMYGSVFTVLVLLISSTIMIRVALSYIEFCKNELFEIGNTITETIEERGFITSEELEELNNDNRVVHVTIREFTIEPGSPEEREFFGSDFNKPQGLPPGFERPGGFMGRYMSHITYASYEDRHFGIIIERSFEHEMKTVRSFALVFVVMNAIGITGAFFAGKYMSKKILAPIIAITNTAESIGANDLRRRIEYEGPKDEIKVLADTFNEMIERLEIAFNRQTQFISDASHELRTPISVIQGYANLIDRWGKDDPEILQEAIDSIKSETEHMSLLIKKLLFLARSDRNEQINKKIISLNDVVNEVIKELSVLDIKSSIEIIEEEEVPILADYDLIKQMVWIFMENSTKYARKENSEIVIKVFRNESACISVKDNGIGIGEEDLPLIFERFYRADKSRSKEIPGEGIGLSIASWIIREHNGKVDVKSKVNEGTEIIVRLPLA